MTYPPHTITESASWDKADEVDPDFPLEGTVRDHLATLGFPTTAQGVLTHIHNLERFGTLHSLTKEFGRGQFATMSADYLVDGSERWVAVGGAGVNYIEALGDLLVDTQRERAMHLAEYAIEKEFERQRIQYMQDRVQAVEEAAKAFDDRLKQGEEQTNDGQDNRDGATNDVAGAGARPGGDSQPDRSDAGQSPPGRAEHAPLEEPGPARGTHAAATGVAGHGDPGPGDGQGNA
jgi:hypothetical protein